MGDWNDGPGGTEAAYLSGELTLPSTENPGSLDQALEDGNREHYDLHGDGIILDPEYAQRLDRHPTPPTDIYHGHAQYKANRTPIRDTDHKGSKPR